MLWPEEPSHALRQYLYFWTSKASKLRSRRCTRCWRARSRVNPCTLLEQMQLRQHLYFCPRKASKLRTSAMELAARSAHAKDAARACVSFFASVYLSLLALLVHQFTSGSAHAKDAARACVASSYEALRY